MKPATAAGNDAVRMRGLFGGETEERATQWVLKIEAQASREIDPTLLAQALCGLRQPCQDHRLQAEQAIVEYAGLAAEEGE